MPIVDQDQITIHRTGRDGSNSIWIEWEWTSGQTGQSSGKMTSSWDTADQARQMVEESNQDDIMRAILSACINKTTGAFRPAVFDGMGGGKQYVVQSKVNLV